MPGLVLTLAPHERIYVNGALIENGDRRCVLRLPVPDTEFLRERDMIAATAPADTLGAACELAQRALTRPHGRKATLAQLQAQLHDLQHEACNQGNEDVRAAACQLSDGSLAGAHFLLLRALRARDGGAANALIPLDPKTARTR